MNISPINVLAAVRLPSVARYREYLSKDQLLKVTVVTAEPQAREILSHPDKRTDVFVVDNGMGNVFELVKELRQSYPRLIIVLVDEEADFGMPGRADDVSTTPFKEDELIKKIKRLTEDRSLETLRADALPPVRGLARLLGRAKGGMGKQQATVEAVKELGYDYVVFYTLSPTDPPSLALGAQTGPNAITSMIPPRTDYNNLLGWVAQNGQSRIVGPTDTPNHFLIEKGKYAAGVCVPVGSTLRFGVIFACREQAGTITQQNVMMIELVSAQLASSMAKEQRG